MINTLWSVDKDTRGWGICFVTPVIYIFFGWAAINKVGYEIETWIARNSAFAVGITDMAQYGCSGNITFITRKEILPMLLLKDDVSNGKIIYKVVFKEQDMVKALNKSDNFDLQHYYQHPEEYESRFSDYINNLNVLVHGSYWDVRYPRVVTKNEIKKLYSEKNPKLIVVGDISCDPDGGIELHVELK